MALQCVTPLNVDFYNKKYILVNAKQYDKNSRFLSVTCYNNGELYPINSLEHASYVRYKKSDDYAVFNSCDIDSKGKIIVELTEQMLSSDGICDVDLMIVNKGGARVDSDTGEIITIDNASILSSMVFHIDVHGTAVEYADIESSYEYDGLNVALEKAEAEYENVILASKSWAVGETGIDDRPDENTNNSKYWANQASIKAIEASSSVTNASISEDNAESYMKKTLEYKNFVENIVVGLDSGFVPMGTVSFSELASVEKATGYVYNISDDFVTTDDFREGAGKSYTAGTNVYITANGEFDCLGGMSAPTATADEVKSYLGI